LVAVRTYERANGSANREWERNEGMNIRDAARKKAETGELETGNRKLETDN
jgi:hypothetical protein